MSGGSGCPGGVIRFCESLGKQSLRLEFVRWEARRRCAPGPKCLPRVLSAMGSENVDDCPETLPRPVYQGFVAWKDEKRFSDDSDAWSLRDDDSLAARLVNRDARLLVAHLM